MRKRKQAVEDIIAGVPANLWRNEFEKNTSKYHYVAAWAAIIFDPLFAVTDYLNIPQSWETLLYIRLSVSYITLMTLFGGKRFNYPSVVIVIVPFTLISLQNAFTYSLIGNENLLGHNLNYMALFIGAAMFLAWEAVYSIGALVVSAIATAYFIANNPNLSVEEFFVKGGLLLIAVGAFMFALIKTRYNLTVKEIRARLALQLSNDQIQAQNIEIHLQNEEIQSQAEKIKAINDNLERIVAERTADLQRKNKALEDYAFINAHKLRSPVASILGLVNLAKDLRLDEDGKEILSHLRKSSEQLDDIVNSITKTIEKADRPTRFQEEESVKENN
jgi:signal transduction histidine kinase